MKVDLMTIYWHPNYYWPSSTTWQRRDLMRGLRNRLGDRRFANFIADVFVLSDNVDATPRAVAIADLPDLCEDWDKAHPESRLRKVLRKLLFGG
jgi:hypothetical protein